MVTIITDRDQAEAVLLELLSETAKAHGEYEVEHLGGQYDQEWPRWYARHMSEALAAAGYALAKTKA